MDASSSYSGIPTGYPYERERSFHERDRLEYELTVRQEPKQARMCGVGADRRPIDPPPIIQLRVIDPHTRQPPSPANPDIEDSDPNYAHSFLQNPYYFMFASLAKPDDDTELHWLKDGKTRCTTGSVVSSLYHLKDTENRNEDAGFFVFPDLSVRTEGSYRLKLSLFEVVGNTVRHCKSIYSAPFYVYTAKKFPGMEESTPLSCSLADQGIKIRIRKDIRVRKRPIAALAAPLDSGQGHGDNGKMEDEHGETEEHQHQQAQQLHSHGHQGHMGAGQSSSSVTAKRARHGTLTGPLSLPPGSSSSGEMTPHTPSSANPASVALPGLPAWPTSTSLHPMLGVASAPGGIELTGTHTHAHSHSAAGTIGSAHPGGGVGETIPPPPGAAYEGSRMASGTGVGNIPPPPGAQLLSGGENSGSGSVRRGSVLPLSSSSSASSLAPGSAGASASTQNLSPVGPPPPGTGAGSIYDRMSYETPRPAYDSGTRGASYDQQRGVGGGAGYENGNARNGYDNGSGRNGYDNASGRNGYENGGGRGGYDHPQQQRGSYESRGSYDSQSHSRGSYDAQTHAQSQRASYSAPYDAPPGPPTQTYQDGHNQGGYTHPQQQQQTSANYPQPSQTHAYPGTSSHTHHQGQYPPPTRSQYPATAPGHGYPNSYQPAQGPQGRYDYATPSASANANSSGTYYDNPPQPSPASASSTSQAHSYYSNTGPTHSTSVPPPLHHHSPTSATSATSASTWAPPAPPPPTHTQSYASSTASGGSQYEYGGQGQGQSNEYYQHPQGHPHPHQHPSTSASHSGRVLSPGPGPSPNTSTSRYAPPPPAGQYSGSEPSHARGPPPFASGAPAWGPNGGAGTHQQQEMIHLAPLRHAGVASGASSSSSPSSPPLSSVVGAGAGGGGGQGGGQGRGYPSLMQFSRAPFEQDTGRGMGLPGVPGKKSVLSIGSIISDGG
ncbi:hypothetical protein PAXINDRAFT_101260 [Paxillus involutus ATCC 200175]|uniref:Velvet domain-containing protein n=1 Tax=Paxillus involutus ATCC 200175 TaxID=664439 RepID=A0A0C9TP49_PAXIN|nr:hypothetical protein PAXINDRAFT_101260 [Paxillus involutus ATCC 200175]